MIRPAALVLYVASFMLVVGTVAAASPVSVSSVAAGGVNHLVVYPLNDDSKAARVESALPTIIANYEALWKSKPNTPMPFQMLIDTGLEAPGGDDWSDTAMESVKLPVASAPAEWTGETEADPTTACHIKLFDAAPLNAPNQLEFELALDAARCYLLHNISAAPDDWWYEGLAHWMAVQVYSPPPASLASLQKDYGDNYNSNLFGMGPEALYFWEFILGGQMQNSPFSDVSTLAQSFGSAPKQFLSLTPDLFYTYANVVAGDQLPWQPAADDLAEDVDLSQSSLPADVELDLEENAIYIANVTLPELDEGKGVTITADGLADSGTIAGIGSAGSFSPIADGEPVDVCGETSVTIISGRALPSNPSSTSLGGPSLTVSEKADCPKPKVPPCLVGTWQLDVPYAGGSVALDGSLQHIFRADGTFTEIYSGLDVTFNYNLPNVPETHGTYVAATYNGTITLERDPKTPGHYIVTSWHRQIEPGGEITVDQAGQTVDVTSSIPELYFGDSAPSAYQCASDDAKNTTWTGTLAGPTTEQLGMTSWTFTRVP